MCIRDSPRPLAAALLAAGLTACGGEPDVVLYCALDQVFSEELVELFEEETGLVVEAVYDTEASKTVGLVASLRSERSAPRCDVFWNNEIANTVALAEEGLLAPYDSPSAAGIPEDFRDPERRWTGFAARARVFIVNTELVPDPSVIGGMEDLLDPRWAGQVVMARPLTGTTLTHMAALYSVLGEERARTFLEAIKRANEEGTVNLASSNGQVMRMVSEGQVAWGWTDTDDYNVARERMHPVDRVFPDQGGEDSLGTLVIPNTVALVSGAPHPEAARKLIDFILSERVEGLLAQSDSAQIPVRSSVPRPAHVADLGTVDVMEVDFGAVGRDLPRRQRELQELFLD